MQHPNSLLTQLGVLAQANEERKKHCR